MTKVIVGFRDVANAFEKGFNLHVIYLGLFAYVNSKTFSRWWLGPLVHCSILVAFRKYNRISPPARKRYSQLLRVGSQPCTVVRFSKVEYFCVHSILIVNTGECLVSRSDRLIPSRW